VTKEPRRCQAGLVVGNEGDRVKTIASALRAVAFVYPIGVFQNERPRARRGQLGSVKLRDALQDHRPPKSAVAQLAAATAADLLLSRMAADGEVEIKCGIFGLPVTRSTMHFITNAKANRFWERKPIGAPPPRGQPISRGGHRTQKL
jgi:hypothetical protein